MTHNELSELVKRVQNDLDNNWAVDADDIRAMIDLISKNLEYANSHEKLLSKAISIIVNDANSDNPQLT
jgi:ABC-type antimicrobial peptide transport system ATPase subunit